MQRVSPHPIEMATKRSAHWSYGRLRTKGTKGKASATSVALEDSGRASLSRRPLGETASEPTTMSSAGGSAGLRSKEAAPNANCSSRTATVSVGVSVRSVATVARARLRGRRSSRARVSIAAREQDAHREGGRDGEDATHVHAWLGLG
eukprot:scaffold43301_cov57-Phaeocystis_antarctica.AAC.3